MNSPSVQKTLGTADGMRDAQRDLERCLTYADILWYRQIIFDADFPKTHYYESYKAGYDYTMGQAVFNG